MPNQSTDLRPWYRQFWPWFLILLPASAVVAGIATVVVANLHADDLVVDDYYKEGLAINRELKRQSAAADLGITAVLQSEGRRIEARLDGGLQLPQIRLRLSHPLEASQDIHVPLQRQAAGVYSAQLPETLKGQWHWTLDAGTGSAWRIDGAQSF